MENNMIELSSKEAVELNGGGWLYDLYRIVMAEANDFVGGFKDGLNNGIK
ncbi:hypothetical protein [Allomuricauda sp. SCSIO 65647]|nr:hypothetical protein [Muricauda sp. SCSIO 65647]UJH66960.1 hypothetical protein L0P89_13485 [Muricauda sp. SCSIO 65647]